jgi:hypothetical protein
MKTVEILEGQQQSQPMETKDICSDLDATLKEAGLS